MKFIDNASRWYRMFSVQALVFVAALQSVLAAFTAEQLATTIPFAGTFTWGALGTSCTVLAAILGAIGRLVDQGTTVDPK